MFFSPIVDSVLLLVLLLLCFAFGAVLAWIDKKLEEKKKTPHVEPAPQRGPLKRSMKHMPVKKRPVRAAMTKKKKKVS